ncbi:MAG: hypothetical protein HY563_04355 [Ignavibacteriales bacterium]|nr:hypothetical protein [Ignavibacteriales bacterium]
MKRSGVLAIAVLILWSHASSQGTPFARKLPLLRGAERATTLQTVRVLGLLVEFQQDADPRTSGTGRFLTSGSPLQIDPPPHDSAYFASKLRFLENYFGKVSNGWLTIQAELFPETVQLADSMAVYAPRGENDLNRLARLMEDSWAAADVARPGFPFSNYDAFIIFHAGVGRDVDLVSLLGSDPTPYDIPSVTINLQTLRAYLDNPLYQGIPVAGGSFHITNSMIIPETETRVFTRGSSVDTFQLGINGLLASSFGSYLGLPDLFDTKTGRSGIGQFGLMDGAAIFAYNGVLPPELSAWEKIFLGWTTPVVLESGTTSITLPAVGLTQSGGDTVYKIPVSAHEYFLIEHRSRDPLGNGQTLSILRGGQVVSMHFDGDTAGFAFNDVTRIYGSLIDAEDFDWALPGSTLEPGFEGGGILLWHIDETDLAAKMATNTLNADPARRTVDLEEADGSQDIGAAYDILDPGSGTENGWPLDFWYSGNSSPVYTNEFDNSTYPNTRANSGFSTFVKIRSFSPRGARMTATVSQGSESIYRVFRTAPVAGAEGVRIAVTDSGIYYGGATGSAGVAFTGNSRTLSVDGFLGTEGSLGYLAVREGAPTYVVSARDSTMYLRALSDSDADGIFDVNTLSVHTFGDSLVSGPIIADSAGIPHAFAGTAQGRILTLRLDNGALHLRDWGSGPIRDLIAFPGSGPWTDELIDLTKTGLTNGSSTFPLGTPGNHVRGVRFGGSDLLLVNESPLTVSVIDRALSGTLFRFSLANLPFSISTGGVQSLVPTDLDRDGVLDIVVRLGNMLMVLNARGTLLDGFPVRFQSEIMTEPLVADFTGDSRPDILVLTREGVLHVVDADGRVVDGFSVQVSGPVIGTPAVFRSPAGSVRIAVAPGNGALDVWEIARPYANLQREWFQERGNAAKTGVSVISTVGTGPISTSFLPSERVYNWPNPVYGPTTRIRFYTSDPARISIRILTLAGETVAELQTATSGGADEEVPWDVSGIESGIYFAHVEALGSGKHEAVVIKIAVVK